jgi:hypothetical protein
VGEDIVVDRSSEEFCEAMLDGHRAGARSAQGKDSAMSS